jgi:pimeloyl-ACP methyl ester carboxylesterase
MSGPTSHTFTSQRLRMHYVDWGNEDAEPMLMVHGGRDHARNWDWVAERLQPRYHILAMDLRGHGESDWAPGGAYGHAQNIQDIAQLIHQKIGQPTTIIGHSLGAMLSLAYAGAFPETVKKLIAIDGIAPDPELDQAYEAQPVEERLRGWIEDRRATAGRFPRRYPTLESAVARMQEENQHLTDAQARHLTRHGAQQNEDGTYTWKFDNAARFGGGPTGQLSTKDQYRLWSRITCPVLLVRGSDSFFPDPEADGRLQHLPTARQVTIPGAGHWVHHDQLELFMAEIRRFLDA